MTDILFIITIIIVIGLLGGLIYLIYLPFKNRLKKSGKLTDKQSRQINWIFVLSLCLAGGVFYCFKDYRTSSKDRLEEISDIKLPANFKVLKDEYQDMLQDYCILYDIQFDNNSMTDLIGSIQSSKFYNPHVNSQSQLHDSLYISIDNEKAIWCKSNVGYRFSRQDGGTSYSIQLDTLTNTLEYIECDD